MICDQCLGQAHKVDSLTAFLMLRVVLCPVKKQAGVGEIAAPMVTFDCTVQPALRWTDVLACEALNRRPRTAPRLILLANNLSF